jgi:hypothetical protein
MRILAVGDRSSGVTYHRLALPLSIMKKDYCLITDVISEELLKEKQFDIVVINRFYNNEPLQTIMEWRQKYGFKLIVDIDDYWVLYEQHPSQNAYRKLGITGVITSYIRMADLVTCTHNRLALEIKKINPEVYVLPNGLPFDKDQFIDTKLDHDKVNIVHTGSIMHFADIKQIKSDMVKLSKSKAFVEASRMVVCGWHDYNDWHWKQIADILTAKQKLDYQVLNHLPVESYMNFYNEADILIVPLLDNKFNRMKSNLKALEAGAKRIPIMTYKKPPYDDIPTCFFVDDWEKDLKRMAFSKQMRVDFGEANAEYVRKHYDIFKINEERYAIYNKLISK